MVMSSVAATGSVRPPPAMSHRMNASTAASNVRTTRPGGRAVESLRVESRIDREFETVPPQQRADSSAVRHVFWVGERIFSKSQLNGY